jgi:hypothetical protein
VLKCSGSDVLIKTCGHWKYISIQSQKVLPNIYILVTCMQIHASFGVMFMAAEPLCTLDDSVMLVAGCKVF